MVEELRRDLAEARDQQAATSDILRVISSSPTDLQRVVAEVAESAARLCDAYDAVIWQADADVLRLVAHHGPIEVGPVGQFTLRLVREFLIGRIALERRTIQVADLQTEIDEYPEGRDHARRFGYHTQLGVPLIRAGEAIGVIAVRRTEVRPFTERQVELLRTFADQAVIAIENARLFDETREALERQTATAEVLKVIASSPADVQPVLDAIAAAGCRLLGGHTSILRLLDGDAMRFGAMFSSTSTSPEVAIRIRQPLMVSADAVPSELVAKRKPVIIVDTETDHRISSANRDIARGRGYRSFLAVPLVRGEAVFGALNVSRREPGTFADKEVVLLQTFADQAVIAIENVRLFEEIAQKSRELEIASQHKSQFVANMSHELRTPLAAILGYAELMQEGFYGALSEKSTDALTRIRSNGKHLLGLINTVLDIAKIESGQFSLNLAEYALDSVVETVRVATESLAETKKLSLKTDVAKKLPVGLGDEQRLTQVLLNLVGNAIKFTDTGEVRITATAMNGHFTVAVTDTGPGIPPEELKRVFEQFHQIDNSNTKAKGGTGLGLAIAKQIVEMHGGRIWVESTLGKGATFQMELPIRAEDRKGPSAS